MPDDLPAMTANEALLQLRAIAKPFKALLEMDRIFAAAIEAERGLHDIAGELDTAKAEHARLTALAVSANSDLQSTRAETVNLLATSRASAAAIVNEAKAAAKLLADQHEADCICVQKNAEKALRAADEAQAALATEVEGLLARKTELATDIEAASGKLETIRAAIAKLTAG